jgi:hypothetical protein
MPGPELLDCTGVIHNGPGAAITGARSLRRRRFARWYRGNDLGTLARRSRMPGVLGQLIHNLRRTDQMCGPLISEIRAVHLRHVDLGSQTSSHCIRRIGVL